MRIPITMKTRDGSAFASGFYSETETVVFAGGKVSPVFRAGNVAQRYRDDPKLVDSDGNILNDCSFSSPSLAAQFVNGNYSNGYRVWKAMGKNLGVYLSECGLK